MKNLQEKLFSKSHIAFVILHMVCAALWFAPFFFKENSLSSVSIAFAGIPFLELSPFFATISQFLFFVILGNVINHFLFSIRLIPFQNRYFYFIFFLSVSFVPQVQSFGNASIAFAFFLLSTSQLIQTFQSENVFRVFNSALFLSIAVFFKVEYIYFLPFILFALLLLRAFTLRTFFASLLGMLAIAFIFFSILYLNDNAQILQSYFALAKQMGGFNFINSLNLLNSMGISFLFVSLIFYVSSFFFNRYTKSINVRFCSAFMNLFLIAIFVVYAINFQQVDDSLILLLFSICYFATLFYIHNRSKFSSFSLLIVLSIGLLYRVTSLLLM